MRRVARLNEINIAGGKAILKPYIGAEPRVGFFGRGAKPLLTMQVWVPGGAVSSPIVGSGAKPRPPRVFVHVGFFRRTLPQS